MQGIFCPKKERNYVPLSSCFAVNLFTTVCIFLYLLTTGNRLIFQYSVHLQLHTHTTACKQGIMHKSEIEELQKKLSRNWRAVFDIIWRMTSFLFSMHGKLTLHFFCDIFIHKIIEYLSIHIVMSVYSWTCIKFLCCNKLLKCKTMKQNQESISITEKYEHLFGISKWIE